MNLRGFECIRCGTAEGAGFTGFRCPACGGNLQVIYDYAAARRGFPTARGDIFRYASALPIRDLANVTPLRVGMTPLYKVAALGAQAGAPELWIKDDGLNPSASFKDRASAVALAVARERGAAVVAGATTGNAGSSMACLAASMGMRCVVFLPESAPPAKIAQLLVFGARVVAVRGTYDQAFDLCAAVCERRGWFIRNTGSNPFTREGKKTCAYEIWEQLGDIPEWVAVSCGDGNILSGLWKGFCDLAAMGLVRRRPKLLCAQADTSDAVARTIQRVREAGEADWSCVQVEKVRAATCADSIAVDEPRDGLAAVRAVIESGGAAVTASDEEILAAIPELARGAGVFCEPAAAAGWASVRKAAAQGIIRPDERVVVVLTGHGLKDIVSARRVAGEPQVIDATLDAAMAATEREGG
jgi:threonine synthase